MKKFNKNPRLWIVALTLLLASTVSAQEVPYTPFNFEGNPVWTDAAFMTGFGFQAQGQLKISVSGDTLINGIVYHKLFTNYILSPGWEQYDNYVLSGFIRETPDHKVLFLSDQPDFQFLGGFCEVDTTQEYILYDFNLSVGDSLINKLSAEMFSNVDSNQAVVDSIGVVTIDEIVRNAYFISSYNLQWVWIEGIGSDGAFLSPMSANEYFSADYCYFEGIHTMLLTCYSDDSVQYHNQFLDNWVIPYTPENGLFIDDYCTLILNRIDENESITGDLTVSPNPTQDHFYVNYNSPKQGFEKAVLILTDIYGKVSEVRPLSLNTDAIYYDCSELAHGTYIITLELDGVVIESKKIVIQ